MADPFSDVDDQVTEIPLGQRQTLWVQGKTFVLRCFSWCYLASLWAVPKWILLSLMPSRETQDFLWSLCDHLWPSMEILNSSSAFQLTSKRAIVSERIFITTNNLYQTNRKWQKLLWMISSLVCDVSVILKELITFYQWRRYPGGHNFYFQKLL